MLKVIKEWNPLQKGVLMISFVLVFLAEIAASSACLLFWHEPDCPEDMIR